MCSGLSDVLILGSCGVYLSLSFCLSEPEAGIGRSAPRAPGMCHICVLFELHMG